MKKLWLLLLFLMFSCKKNNYLILKELKIDVFEKVNSCDFIEMINQQKLDDYLLKNPNFKEHCYELNTSKVGFIVLKFFDKEYLLEVVDEIPPEIKIDDIRLKINDDFDFNNYLKVSDNYDKLLFTNIKGFYKLDQIGEYLLEVEAVDSSKNKSKKSFKLTVVADEKNNDDNNVLDVKIHSENIKEEVLTTEINTKEAIDKILYSIEGVKDIKIAIDSELSDLIFLLTNNIIYQKAYQLDYSNVNLSVQGDYDVYYYDDINLIGKCKVIVE